MPKKKLTGHIFTYSKKARHIFAASANAYLAGYGIEGIPDNLILCIDELVKNAVKANYKFILIKDCLYSRIEKAYPEKSDKDINNEIMDIIKIQESYDHIADEIIESENIHQTVRELLNEESQILNVKNKAFISNRKYTDEEQKTIYGPTRLNMIRAKMRKNDIKIIIQVQADKDYIYCEVTNTAPILTKDLNRIYSIRDRFNKYREEGREQDFFINNLDTSESGFGLGYATIDSILNDWKLDPFRALTIISSINTTIMLCMPKHTFGVKKIIT